MDISQDRRKHQRHPVSITDITGKMLFAKNIEITDISVGGISLITDRKLDVGTGYILRIEWEGKGLTVKVIVKWSAISQKMEHPGGAVTHIYKVGMEFINTPEEDIRRIITFLRRREKAPLEETQESLEKIRV
jgi:hypothetical protein